MSYSTQAEIRTFAALQRALAAHGYLTSQKARVLDVVRAAAAAPATTVTPGPALGDVLVPALREAAGPFDHRHPWLRPGDWNFAFKSHFDFVVHAPLGERHATHPLFAVEFDGPTHSTPSARSRDVRKNRLCLASGLPLVRVDTTFLHERERLSLIEWLATLWAAHRREMPSLLAERDAEVAAMDAGEFGASALSLLCERPELDVDLLFRLSHPYPPTRRLAARLARRFGFSWPSFGAHPAEPRWSVGQQIPPVPSLNPGILETWTCEVELHGPSDQVVKVRGMVELRTGYPIEASGAVNDSWEEILAGRMPFLPAGPWLGAAGIVGEALCQHNVLHEVEQWLTAHR